MKSYVINLARARERRAHMVKQCSDLGIEIVRIEAVDGRGLSDAEVRAVCPGPGRTHQMSAVEVACFLSHRAAWAAIAAGDDSHGAVLEDDLLISASGAAFLRDGAWISPAADIVKVETIARPVLLVPPHFNAGAGRTAWRSGSLNMGGGGYIVSRACARLLVSETETFRDPVDYVLFDPAYGLSARHRIFQLVPAICVQQVRSSAIFMSNEAAASQMDGARGTVKPRGLAKLFREISRPVAQGGRWVAMTGRALAAGGRYMRVPIA